MPPSATLRLNELSDQLRREGKQVYKLGLGQSPFPVPRPVIEELQANAHQKDYLPVRGLPRLRQEVAEYHRRINGVPRFQEDVLIGPGSKELMFLLQIVYYGDLVVPTPCWVSYAPQARIVGRNVQFIHTTAEQGWRLMPRDLEALCVNDPGRPRIFVLNYPSNPTGQTYTLEELKALAHAARECRVVLLSDEIYGALHHRGQHISVARFYPEGTIISGGLSKWCGAGGWRLGTFTFPPSLRWLLDAMAAVASETYTSTSAPIQYAAVRAYKGGIRIERYLWHARRILSRLGRAVTDRLRQAGVAVELPKGAFYLFPDFSPVAEKLKGRGISTSAELCTRLLEETGVAMLPGSDFGRSPGEMTARIAYVDFDGAKAMAASEVMKEGRRIDEEFLETHCGCVLEATDRIAAWLA
jgi:aspartate aminotransferase